MKYFVELNTSCRVKCARLCSMDEERMITAQGAKFSADDLASGKPPYGRDSCSFIWDSTISSRDES